ncbi:MAG: Hpt domain-containing protein, partial [Pseudomonadota bacterium]
MAKSREHFALDWIKGELLETLNGARQALEAFVESDRDETRMRACLTGLHQVHGTLVMLELAGVTLLADHLEQLAQKMLSGGAAGVDDEAAASQLLMQGILELPGHLEAIQSGGRDDPRAVARLVNEIREQLGEAPLELGAEVASIARNASEASLSRFQDIDGAEKTRKIRAAYQQVLLSILKGDDVSGSVDMLSKVARSLQRVCAGTPHEQQWEAFGEFVASLAGHTGALSGVSVKLLRRIDSEIRTLGQNGIQSLKEPVSLELVAQLLDAAAERDHQSEVTARLREELAGADEDEGAVSPSGRQALSSAAAALREELLLVKDQLDLIVRAGGDNREGLLDLIAPLKQIGSTLSLLGFESSKSIVADQIDTLNDLGEGAALDQSTLIGIASALVQVDENLASFAQGGKNEAELIVDSAQKAVTVEARQGLDQVKQDVVDFISSEWDPRHLSETPNRITEICGALDMIPLSRASSLLSRCGQYVAASLAQGHTPSWEEMDQFADAVSGLDYYLERIGEASGFAVDDVLDLVERSLDALPMADAAAVATPLPEPAGADDASPSAAEMAPAGVDAEPDTGLDTGTDTEALAGADAVLGDTPPVDLPSDIDEEEEEPKLEMDDDPGFDLSGTDFDDFGAAASTPATEEDPALPEPPAPELPVQGALDPADDLAADAEATTNDPSAAPAAVVATLPPGREPSVDPSLADSFESDEEIVEIFVEEVDEVLETIDEWLPAWRGALDNEEALTEVRRSFHTLKGSGRIVGANVIGEVAWSVENMLNRLIDGTVAASDQFLSVVEQARALIPTLKEAFEAQQAPELSTVGLIMEMADILSSGGSLEDASADSSANAPIELADEFEGTDAGATTSATAAVEELADDLSGAEEIPVAADSEVSADEEDWSAPAEEVIAGSQETDADVDEALVIFIGEARGHLIVLREAVAPDAVSVDEAFVRALHTLSGSAGMAEITAVQELARPTYELASALRGTADTAVTGEAAGYLTRAVEALTGAVDALEAGAEPADHLQLIAEADHLIVAAQSDEVPTATGDRMALMALDGLADVMSADEFLRAWKDGAMDLAFGDRLVQALTEVRDAALKEHVEPIADLAHAFAGALTRLADDTLGESVFNALLKGHDRLMNQFDALAAEQQLDAVDDVVKLLDSLGYGNAYADEEFDLDDATPSGDEEIAAEALTADEDNIVAFPGDGRDEIEISLESLEDALLDEVQAGVGSGLEGQADDLEVAAPRVRETAARDEIAEIEVPPAAIPAAVAELLPEEVDEEIIEVFFEEADEILEGLEENIHRWSSEPDNRLYLEHLLRGLHTLKGGARLSGLTKLGDATHQFESFLIDVQNAASDPDDGFFDDLNGRYDGVTNLLTVIRKALAGEAVAAPEAGVLEVAELPAEDPAPIAAAPSRDEPPAPPLKAVTDEPPEEPAAARATREEQGVPETRQGQEMVRVGSGLLEDLVNLAGESSIVRARVEQGMSDFTGALEEMETTIERLREQLRRLEIETEAQILFRQDRPDGPAYTNFDPLEMDRYSQLQQLSRGLTESASDMLDLKETLLFKARESETLLLQQARINTELQEGLMRTRMVPFSRLLPRLRRIVRQVSAELGKEVEFHAYNAEGELDRSLLERMVPPLEHMLRNAVDHGIEPQELRANFGKPNAGRIDLRLSREGGDVVIEISDDGAGIDVESVRAKAVERGLMAKDATLTDEEISQFVLAPGFSTAKSVTQIS